VQEGHNGKNQADGALGGVGNAGKRPWGLEGTSKKGPPDGEAEK